MQTQALIFMVVTESVITALTLYFFIRVLIVKPKSEPDSFMDVPK